MSIRIGILGYGNLGKGVEKAVNMNPDQELAAVFTRRDPKTVRIASEGVEVRHTDDLEKMTDQIDVLVICGGSATDLPEMTPKYAALYNVVDSFDTHANIPAHFCHVNQAALSAGKVGIISCGWDPGMFSLSRLYAHSVLPDGHDYTFWGRGVSQGHSDAIRRIDGVKDARQYTVPVEDALQAVRDGLNPQLTVRQKHTRECWVVAEDGADTARMLPRTAPTRPASKKRSRKCRITSLIMTRPYTLFRRKNSCVITGDFPTAVLSSIPARPAIKSM